MNDDALAAVVAAAQLIVARSAAPTSVSGETASRWALAGRIAMPDARQARRFARARSRWMLRGRLDG